jgi:hypothetical protein
MTCPDWQTEMSGGDAGCLSMFPAFLGSFFVPRRYPPAGWRAV